MCPWMEKQFGNETFKTRTLEVLSIASTANLAVGRFIVQLLNW